MTDGNAICVLINAGSGKKLDDARSRIEAALKRAGVTADLRVIKTGSQIAPETQRAMSDGYGIIVAAGGDGTMSGIAEQLTHTEVAMGVLPLGTFNYFARSLDIPEDLDAAAQLLAGGVRRPIRVGAINDRVFLNNASLGAYPAILRTREDIYRRWGRSRVAAYWSVLVTLLTLRRPLRLTITANGRTEKRRTPLAFAVNNAFQLNQIGLEGAEEIAAGRMALFIAPDSGRFGMVRHALSLAMGRATRNVDFEFFAASQIDIDAKRSPRDVACDGERASMRAPYTLRAIEDALDVIVPETSSGGTR